MTLSCLLHPEFILKKAPYRVDVETNSTLTRGYAVMAWDKFDVKPNASVIEQADKKAYFELLDRMLSKETTPNLPFKGL